MSSQSTLEQSCCIRKTFLERHHVAVSLNRVDHLISAIDNQHITRDFTIKGAFCWHYSSVCSRSCFGKDGGVS